MVAIHLMNSRFLRVGFRVFHPVRSVEDVFGDRVDKSRRTFRVSPLARR